MKPSRRIVSLNLITFFVGTFVATAAFGNRLQGLDDGVVPVSEPPYLINIPALVVLLSMSALFSGLTQGVMSLDSVSLRVVATSGQEPDKSYAKNIIPVRDLGHWLLSTLLLGNTLVNVLVEVLLAEISTGIIGVVSATIAITLFGEVLPMAVTVANQLSVGSACVPIIKVLLFLFAPIAWPIGKLCDCLVRKDVGQIYERKELLRLMAKHAEKFAKESGLHKNEVDLMAGAMEFEAKHAEAVMTRLEDVFGISDEDVLNQELLMKIWQQGHSKIPIFSAACNTTMVGILVTKDLILVDPMEAIPVARFSEQYPRFISTVPATASLKEVLRYFTSQQVQFGAVVRNVAVEQQEVEEQERVDEEPASPASPMPKSPAPPHFFKERVVSNVIGIITLEDVVEELIKQEIFDETDNQPLHRVHILSYFPQSSEKPTPLTHEQKVACATYLQRRFAHMMMSDAESLQLVQMSSILEVYPAVPDATSLSWEASEKNIFLYEKSKRTDKFTLLIMGKVQIRITAENFVIERGSWTPFGKEVIMTGESFVPDFSARVVEPSRLMVITVSTFNAFKRRILYDTIGNRTAQVPVDTPQLLTLVEEDQSNNDKERLSPQTPQTMFA